MSSDPLLLRARTRVGSVLCAKYRLDGVLGIGGMAAVFAATHLRNTNRVAVKVLHRELALDADLRSRFLREGYASNTVEHPGAVRILDDDTAEDGSVFLVMELLEGEPLDARWERNGLRLPVDEVVSIALQVLDILSAAHAKGIVHRDVKPDNLFMTHDGRVKLLDFGVARLRELSPTITRSGSMMGTPAFMPPEQALGRKNEVDALSDVWAVAATAFALVSGRFVHVADSPEEILVKSATQPAPPLLSVAPHVPPAIAAVFDRALAYAKRDRWQSARDMQQGLAEVSDHALGVPRSGPATRADVGPVAGAGGSVAVGRAPAPSTPAAIGGVSRHEGGSSRRSVRFAARVIGAFVALVALVAAAASVHGRRTVVQPTTTGPSPAHAASSETAVAPLASPELPSVAVLAPAPGETAAAGPTAATRPAAAFAASAAEKTAASATAVPAATVITRGPSGRPSTSTPAKAPVPANPKRDPLAP